MERTGDDVSHLRRNYLVRGQMLLLGEETPWHRDRFRRVTVVLSGDPLRIESRDGVGAAEWQAGIGEVDWAEPTERVYRAVNLVKKCSRRS